MNVVVALMFTICVLIAIQLIVMAGFDLVLAIRNAFRDSAPEDDPTPIDGFALSAEKQKQAAWTLYKAGYTLTNEQKRLIGLEDKTDE